MKDSPSADYGTAIIWIRGEGMHFEILVEDQSGKTMLDILVPKIISDTDTFKIISYKGIGHIPKNMHPKTDPSKRILMENLPRLLRGYGKAGFNREYSAVVIVVCDLDTKCLKTIREELFAILNACNPRPETRFCFAIEEGEAWLLGDIAAIKQAYPKAKKHVLEKYQNDAVCDTWEVLADAIIPEGSEGLSKKGWRAIGYEKTIWAKKIAPYIDIDNNGSPSFQYFCSKLKEFCSN